MPLEKDIFTKYLNKKLLSSELRKQIALINNGIIEMRRASFDSALINFWTVIETILKDIWGKFLMQKDITKDRRKFLTGRDLTASVIVECLSLHGIIEETLYKKITETRKTRNSFMHELKDSVPSVLNTAYSAFEELLYINYSIRLKHRTLIFMGDVKFINK